MHNLIFYSFFQEVLIDMHFVVLLQNGSISSDIVLLFAEMYLQKSEECVDEATYEAEKERNLYKILICFMIVGLKEKAPCVIKPVPETKISGELQQEEIINCIETQQRVKFKVRGVLVDNHSSNFALLRGLTERFGKDRFFASVGK